MASRAELLLEITSRLDQAVAELGKVKGAIVETETAAAASATGVAGLRTELDATGAAGVSAFGGMAAAAKTLGAVVIASGVTDFLSDSIREAVESERVWNQLGNTVKRAGVDWGAASEQVAQATAQLQLASQFDDESIGQALNTLVGLTRDYHASLTLLPAVLDAAVGKGEDLAGITEAIGKAAAGSAATLSRYGIVLDDATRAQLEMGTAAERVEILMSVLNERWGGAARNDLETYGGKLDVLANQWGELKEAVGGAALELAGLDATMDAGAFAREVAAGTDAAKKALDIYVAAIKASVAPGNTLGQWLGQVTGYSEAMRKQFLDTTDAVEDQIIVVKRLSDELSGLTDSQAVGAAGMREAAQRLREFEASTTAAAKAVEQMDRDVIRFGDAALEELAAGLWATDTAVEDLHAAFVPVLDDLQAMAELERDLQVETEGTFDTIYEAVDTLGEMLTFEPAPPNFAGWRTAIDELAVDFEASLGSAITRGIEAAGEGELTEYLDGLFNDWAGLLYDAMGSALSEAFSTGSFSEGLANYVQAIEQNPLMFGLGGAAMVYQATQAQDRTVGTLQGAIGGAQTGYAMSQNWIGAVIGAVVGGAAGYFGSGGYNPRTSFSLSPGQHATVHTIGQDRPDQVNQQLADQIQSAYSEFRLSYLRLAQMFEDPELLDALGTMPALYTGAIEGTADELMEWLIGDWMPDAFETAFRPIFEEGLAGLGVNSETMGALFGELAGLEGQARVESLETYIRAVVNSARLLEDMNWDAMTEEAMRSPRQAFVAAMTEGLEDIDVMMSGWDNLSLLEQADQALNVQEAITAAREMELQYLAQLMQLQEELIRSIAGQREALVFGGMDPTEQRAYLEGQLAAIFAELGTEGLDPNRVAQLTADAQRYIDQLRQLFGDALDEPLRQPATLPGGSVNPAALFPPGSIAALQDAAAAGRALEDAFNWGAMLEDFGRTARDVFQEDVVGGLEDVALAFEAINWTDPAALAQAQELQGVIAAAREQELAYMAEILRIQDQIVASIARQREGFLLEGMDTGEQFQYAGLELTEIFRQLQAGNLSPEQVEALTAEAQRYIGMLGSLAAGEEGVNPSQYMIGLLDTLQELSLAALGEATAEAEAANAAYLDWLTQVNSGLEDMAAWLDGITGGPSGALVAPGQEAVTDEPTARDYLVDLLDTLASLAPAAIQDSIDEAEALNQEYLDRLEEVNAALVRFRHNLDGEGDNSGRIDQPGVHGISDEPTTPTGDDDDDFGDGGYDGDGKPRPGSPEGEKSITFEEMVNAFRVALSGLPAPQVTVTGSVAPMIQLIQTVVAASRVGGGGVLS